MPNDDEFLQEQEEMPEADDGTSVLGEYITRFRLQAQKAIELDTRIFLYRGQSDKRYSLMPSVFRNGLLENEHLLIQDMLLNSPYEFSGIENTLERLIKMQHYGLPTRLLDITTNPLVALFFACNEDSKKDGEVIVFYEYLERPTDNDVICVAALAECAASTKHQMLKCLKEKGLKPSNLNNLTQISYIPIVAPMNNERIKRQHGVFFLAGIHGDNDGNPYQKTAFDLKPYLVRDSDDGITCSITIPKEDKRRLLKELNTFGINRAFLFPELEHQATHIKNKHEKR